MTSFSCLRTHARIERRASGLSSAEALVLEDHLAGCEPCSTQAKLMAQLRTLALRPNATLAPYERERAISSALRTVQAAPALDAPERGWLMPAAAFTALAALILVLARPQLLERDATPEPVAQRPAPAAVSGSAAPATNAVAVRAATLQDRLLRGEIAVRGVALRDGDAIADGSELRSEHGATLQLAHATVELRAGTEVQWSAARHELRLGSGSLVADVDPSLHQPFSVQTERFSVLVLGTRFSVSPEGVSVTRGRVRVLSPQGHELALLGAGERFTASTSAAAEPQPQPRRDAAALLAEARTQLGDKQVARARKAVEKALGLSLTPALRAEALSLRADCALVAGDRAAAVSAYLRVANGFENLPAAENALFAAGRIEAERGQHEAAARWLTRYLKRYPQGRFVKEARARLRELPPSTDHAP